MTDDDIRAAWERYQDPKWPQVLMPVSADFERGYRDGYEAAHAELDLLLKPFVCDEGWVEGRLPIDDGSKAVPPGDE